MTYVTAILRSAPDPTSAALEIHCVIEGVDEAARTVSEDTIAQIMRLAGQVANGGFDQYFFNSGVWSAKAALCALETIGANDVSALLQRAIAITGLPDPVPPEFEYAPSDAAAKALNELDHLFYAIDESLYLKVVRFAESNAADFGFSDGGS